MNKQKILNDLQNMGNPAAVKIWELSGNRQGSYYGVSIRDIKNYAVRLENNHSLALQLWDTGVHDARLLSVFIEEPVKVTWEQLSSQSAEMESPRVADNYGSYLVAKTRFAEEVISLWESSGKKLPERCAYVTMASLAAGNNNLNNRYFETELFGIERKFSSASELVKEGMIHAIIAIGSRNKVLNRIAVSASRRIWKDAVFAGANTVSLPDPLKVLTGKRVRASLGNSIS